MNEDEIYPADEDEEINSKDEEIRPNDEDNEKTISEKISEYEKEENLSRILNDEGEIFNENKSDSDILNEFNQNEASNNDVQIKDIVEYFKSLTNEKLNSENSENLFKPKLSISEIKNKDNYLSLSQSVGHLSPNDKQLISIYFSGSEKGKIIILANIISKLMFNFYFSFQTHDDSSL